MFKVGDKVVYGTSGVCLIEDITQREIMKKKADYFVLKPIDEPQSTLFVPVDCQQLTLQMRPLLSKQEALDIISDLRNHDDIWINNELERKNRFSSIINSGDCQGILLIIRSIHHQKLALSSQGKHLHIYDKKVYKNAQRIIHNELALVLGIEPDEVAPFIAQKQNA